jgi:hypothetical protein
VKIRLRRLIHYVAALGPAILRLVGVRKGTVAADAVEVAKTADAVLPKESDAPKP